MDAFTFESFAASARAQGFDEIVERQWKPGTVIGTHTHPFTAKALLVQGEMWLSCGGTTQHLLPGDTFALEREVPHDERYGPDGAIYWVARRG